MRPEALFTVPRIERPVLNEVLLDPRRCRILRIIRADLATISYDELPAEFNGEPDRVETSRHGFLHEYSGAPLELLGVMSNEQWGRLAAFLCGEEPEDLTEAERQAFARIQRRLGVAV